MGGLIEAETKSRKDEKAGVCLDINRPSHGRALPKIVATPAILVELSTIRERK
jgi:hypothetical protein